MKPLLSSSLLRSIRELVGEHMGLEFPLHSGSDLERGIAAAASELGFADSDACARWLLSRPFAHVQRDLLARHLTVGETYFFRDKSAFEAIEQEVLPRLIRIRRGHEQHLRIWSAACCSGEEAYSLAVCVRRALPDLAEWRVTIRGTDINPQFLQKADRGIFSEWSFRDTLPEFKSSYFTKTADGRWEIVPEVRRMVSFSSLNLAGEIRQSLESNAPAMDLILCRNALMYFDSKRATRIIHELGQCLSQSGWLVLGPNEVPYVSSPTLIPVLFPGAILHSKKPAGAQAEPPPLSWAARDLSVPVVEQEFTWAALPASPPPSTRSSQSIPYQPAAQLKKIDTPPFTDFERAKSLYDRGLHVEAIAALDELASTEGVEPHVLILLARVLANRGKLNAALVACNRVLADHKMNHVAHYLRAGILQELGSFSESGLALKRVLYLEPDFVLAHFALGSLVRGQGRFAEAERHFKNALALTCAHRPDEILPEADGLTAGRLAEIISVLRPVKAVA